MKPTEEEKKKILEKVEEALDQEVSFLILTEGRPEAAVMMGGSKEDISRMLSIALSRIPDLETIVKFARKALKAARRNREVSDDLDNELLKCDTCDKKDKCEIRSLKERAMNEGVGPEDIMEFLKYLSERHGQIVDVKSKGEC